MSHAAEPSAIRALQRELVECQRQALVGAMTSVVAHELSNLMTPVLARSEDALNAGDVRAMRRALECAVAQTTQAVRVLRELIELTTAETVMVRDARLAEVLDKALLAIARPLEKDGIDVKIDVAPEIAVRAQPMLLEQVLITLLVNARRGMEPRGGRLTIRAEPGEREVTIEVRDSGRSVPRERLASEVAPFLMTSIEQMPADLLGVGMGLNACRTIVQLHSGRLEAEPNSAVGACYRLHWPVAAAAGRA